MNLYDFELNHSSTVPVAYEPFGSEPDLPNNFYSDPYPNVTHFSRAVDPHSFYADPDPDPAVFFNADPDPDPGPDPGPAEPNFKKKNHKEFS